MNNRELAMEWWYQLNVIDKTQICDTNTELLGIRRWETLTGREIEIITK